MILMSLDHASHFIFEYDFDPTNLSYTFPLYFYTRWITHLCAPVFVFLAGVSIHIMLTKRSVLKETSVFLLKRGIWLIFLEITLLSFFWHTHFDVIQLQVIWVIGVAFLLMAFAIRLPRRVNLILAIAIILLHNLLDLVDYEKISNPWQVILMIFTKPGGFNLTSNISIDVLYSILPYFGIMLLGYSMGSVFQLVKIKRRRLLIAAGSLMIIAFFILRITNIYGDPYMWSIQEKGFSFTVMSFLNITKYPPSLHFILFTLGVSFILLAIFERESEQWMKNVRILGQVAMFFYLFHIPILRIIGKVYNVIFENNPPYVLFYLLWLVLVIILVHISKFYATFKTSKKGDKRFWWIHYI